MRVGSICVRVCVSVSFHLTRLRNYKSDETELEVSVKHQSCVRWCFNV